MLRVTPLLAVLLTTDHDYDDESADGYDDKGGIFLLFWSIFWAMTMRREVRTYGRTDFYREPKEW